MTFFNCQRFGHEKSRHAARRSVTLRFRLEEEPQEGSAKASIPFRENASDPRRRLKQLSRGNDT